jgi:hypothetical protein
MDGDGGGNDGTEDEDCAACGRDSGGGEQSA